MIVEEAAKAWSTEIIVPLVLGVRWTLIGDHLQLGPHREEELESFLGSLRGHKDPLVADEYERKDEHLKALRLFQQIFVDKTEDDYKQMDSAVGRIEKQFRMDKTIAEPVSRAFYPRVPLREDNGLPLSFLKTERYKPHDLTTPRFLRDRSLVSVDTSGCEGFGDEPRWRNSGRWTWWTGSPSGWSRPPRLPTASTTTEASPYSRPTKPSWICWAAGTRCAAASTPCTLSRAGRPTGSSCPWCAARQTRAAASSGTWAMWADES